VTLAELEKILEERDATIMIAPSHHEWFISLYAGDDPAAAFFVEVAGSLEEGIAAAIVNWDKAEREMPENNQTRAPVEAEILDDD
jgi:hypothetical protein